MESGRAATAVKYTEQREVMVRIFKFCNENPEAEEWSVADDAKPVRFVKFG